MIAIAYQDGSFMTFRTDFSRERQMEEALDCLEEANAGVRKGAPLARIVDVEIVVKGDVDA